MNRYERRPIAATQAEIEFAGGEFRVIRPGNFVRCAVTGVPIPLDRLRYWNVERQEAYATPEAKLHRLGVRLMPQPMAARPDAYDPTEPSLGSGLRDPRLPGD